MSPLRKKTINQLGVGRVVVVGFFILLSWQRFNQANWQGGEGGRVGRLKSFVQFGFGRLIEGRCMLDVAA